MHISPAFSSLSLSLPQPSTRFSQAMDAFKGVSYQDNELSFDRAREISGRSPFFGFFSEGGKTLLLFSRQEDGDRPAHRVNIEFDAEASTYSSELMVKVYTISFGTVLTDPPEPESFRNLILDGSRDKLLFIESTILVQDRPIRLRDLFSPDDQEIDLELLQKSKLYFTPEAGQTFLEQLQKLSIPVEECRKMVTDVFINEHRLGRKTLDSVRAGVVTKTVTRDKQTGTERTEYCLRSYRLNTHQIKKVQAPVNDAQYDYQISGLSIGSIEYRALEIHPKKGSKDGFQLVYNATESFTVKEFLKRKGQTITLLIGFPGGSMYADVLTLKQGYGTVTKLIGKIEFLAKVRQVIKRFIGVDVLVEVVRDYL